MTKRSVTPSVAERSDDRSLYYSHLFSAFRIMKPYRKQTSMRFLFLSYAVEKGE